MDAAELLKDMLSGGLAAAGAHREELRTYIDARARLIASGLVQLARDRTLGLIDDDDVRFAVDEIRQSEKTHVLALQASSKAAAQDAINAMLGIAVGALNKAVGVPLL